MKKRRKGSRFWLQPKCKCAGPVIAENLSKIIYSFYKERCPAFLGGCACGRQKEVRYAEKTI
ncbi:hypothetical protein DWY69_21135 [Eisenbergiella massiliensis]|uniref:Uncharacterized protein n=1 Tax=Eisenbergiella massiliensis TaxID=1720294 RepID=A0A3E3ILI6_9FIRM|nr:hypothetical protein DWY69_21135 [Eisenbergiella massiliensis]